VVRTKRIGTIDIFLYVVPLTVTFYSLLEILKIYIARKQFIKQFCPNLSSIVHNGRIIHVDRNVYTVRN